MVNIKQFFAIVGIICLFIILYETGGSEAEFEELPLLNDSEYERDANIGVKGKTKALDKPIINQSNGNLSAREDIESSESVKKPKILFWTLLFNGPPNVSGIQRECPLMQKCKVTANKAELLEADAIVFHAPDFYLVANATKALGDIFRSKINVFYSQETAGNLRRYYKAEMFPKNFFHWTMTFSRKSDIHVPYGEGYFVSPSETKAKGFEPIKLPADKETILSEKEVQGVLWFVSNCKTLSHREDAVRELAKDIRVDIAGKCATNEKFKDLCTWDPDQPSCGQIKSRYYFYLAPENDICEDYITEKFFYNYRFPIIPLVMRRAIYENRVPHHSFIAFDDFRDPKAMAEHLKWLISNPDEYMKYFRWRKESWSFVGNTDGYLIGFCSLCSRLLDHKSTNASGSIQPISDVMDWYDRALNCTDGMRFADRWIRYSLLPN